MDVSSDDSLDGDDEIAFDTHDTRLYLFEDMDRSGQPHRPFDDIHGIDLKTFIEKTNPTIIENNCPINKSLDACVELKDFFQLQRLIALTNYLSFHLSPQISWPYRYRVYRRMDDGVVLTSLLYRKATEELLRVADVGTFLIRRSATKANSYSLSVRVSLEDDNSIRHLIIEQKQQADSDKFVYCINGAEYRDLPTLVTHFTLNPIGSSKHITCLRQPAPRKVLETVKCIARFYGERSTDLPFNKGETLKILEKPEEEWWIAKNAMNSVGFIPVNYVERELDVVSVGDQFISAIDRDSREYDELENRSSSDPTTSAIVIKELDGQNFY